LPGGALCLADSLSWSTPTSLGLVPPPPRVWPDLGTLHSPPDSHPSHVSPSLGHSVFHLRALLPPLKSRGNLKTSPLIMEGSSL
uniref:Uncharacterized protein n=1 Tax=Crocodylus porosus TaxID=8502 RepID=A0A7M4EJH0_CROPO